MVQTDALVDVTEGTVSCGLGQVKLRKTSLIFLFGASFLLQYLYLLLNSVLRQIRLRYLIHQLGIIMLIRVNIRNILHLTQTLTTFNELAL